MTTRNKQKIQPGPGDTIALEDIGQFTTSVDMVNHPPHYTQGGVECIDAIKAALGREGFIMFLRGQVIKYQWRLGLKDSSLQDAAKANWYGQRLEQELRQAAEKLGD